MGKVNTFRYIFMGTIIAISITTLGISASLISTAAADSDILPTFLPLDLAVAVITLVVIAPSVVIDFFRKGAFTSMVAVELGWSAVLTIIWIAAAADSTAQLVFLSISCNYIRGYDKHGKAIPDVAANSACHQLQALEAMAWLGAIGLLAWLITLTSLAVTAHSRGNTSVWKKSVTGTNFMKRVARHPKVQKIDYQDYPSGRLMHQENTGYSQQGYPPYPAAQPMEQQAPRPHGQYPAGYNASPPPLNPYNQAGVVQV